MFSRNKDSNSTKTDSQVSVMRPLSRLSLLSPTGRRIWKLKYFRGLLAVYNVIHSIVEANHPLAEGLRLAAFDAPDKRTRLQLDQLAERLERGEALSDVMRTSPRFFPKHHPDLIEAGERTGAIIESLQQVIEDTTELAGRDQYSAENYLYLGYLLMAILGIASFLLVKVIPVYDEILSDLMVEPHPPLSWLIDLYQWNGANGDDGGRLSQDFMSIPTIVLLTAFFWRRNLFRATRSHLLLCLPVFRRWHQKRQLEVASLVIGRLIKGGVPLTDALERASSLDISPVFAKAISTVGKSVELGVPLTLALARHKRVFSSGFQAQVSLGENAGMLGEALIRTAEHYRIDTTASTKIVSDTLRVAVLIPLAAIVAIFAYSTFDAQISLALALMGEM